MTGVPAAGLPNITSTVSRSSSPACSASARWSITANSFMPFAKNSSVRRSTVAATGRGLSLVTIPFSVWVVPVVIVLSSYGRRSPRFLASVMPWILLASTWGGARVHDATSQVRRYTVTALTGASSMAVSTGTS